jgi:hypothetical protein
MIIRNMVVEDFLNCSQILLVTEIDRIDACQFYESVGYNPDTHKGFKKKL